MARFFTGLVQIFVGMMLSVTLILAPKGIAMITRGFTNIMNAFFGAAVKGTAKVSAAAGRAAGEAIGKGIDKMQEHKEPGRPEEHMRDKLDDRETR